MCNACEMSDVVHTHLFDFILLLGCVLFRVFEKSDLKLYLKK